MIKLLLIEDDTSLGETLRTRLDKEGYFVVWAEDLRKGRVAFSSHTFDLVILDVGLPDGSGFDFAREIKKISPVPFLFMTALNTAENRLEGFELGAEEFIPKPFHLKELLMRLDHVLENHKSVHLIHVGGAVLNLDEGSLTTSEGTKEYFQPRDFKLLKFMIEASPRVVSRDEILDLIVGEEQFPSHRTVDNSIVRLRQALQDKNGEIIRSARGVGYQWVGEK